MSDAGTAGPDAWWRYGVVYQVYPRSFQDGNGDGVGDLAGIRERLDYFVDLGVDAIWISPIFRSPMADFGYDVADYCDIDPLFGTLAQFDDLLADAHARGLKLILDFVPNHTSADHPWFIESRRSRDSALRDYYLWRDPTADGGPPNNWRSNFGGSAWTFDATSGQYYYHAFLPEQPDLNWCNPAVREQMFEVMRFWLRRGVDGFRVDVIWHLIKDQEFRDNPLNPDWGADHPESHALLPVYSADRPELMAIIRQMREVVSAFDTGQGSRILIGEIYLPLERLVAYYGPDETGALLGVHLPFNFLLIGAHWQAGSLAALINRYEGALPPGGWPNWVLGNHDKPRIASRVGERLAALAAMLLLTLRGTPTIYYGDEIGMSDVEIPRDRIRDPAELREPGKGQGRDPQRTPMQWSDCPGAGFTSGTPWLPLGPDYRHRNVENAVADPQSMLALHRELLSLRRREAALHAGEIEAVRADGDCLSFERIHGGSRLRVELNFGDQPVAAVAAPLGEVLLTTARFDGAAICDVAPAQAAVERPGPLQPFEGRVLRIG